eukprot:COSAG02_NODE_165_length_32175_cov_86.109490_2_plen_94_part_00
MTCLVKQKKEELELSKLRSEPTVPGISIRSFHPTFSFHIVHYLAPMQCYSHRYQTRTSIVAYRLCSYACLLGFLSQRPSAQCCTQPLTRRGVR